MADDTEQGQPPQLSRQGISRRPVIIGLIGLAVVETISGGLTWKVFSQGLDKIYHAFVPTIPTIPIGTTLYTYRGHFNSVNTVKWSRNGQSIASGGDDQTVQIWNATTGSHSFIYRGHRAAVNSVAWSPDGGRITSGGGAPTLPTLPTPVPAIADISPLSGLDSRGTTVTITGAGFTGASSVSFGSTAATSFNVDSDAQIIATRPAGSGSVDITIITQGGISTVSNADQFSYIAPPVVSSISPTGGLTSGGTTVIISGSGFTGASIVTFGSTAAMSFNVDSDTQITAVSPAGSGQVDITVTTSGGTSASSSSDQFSYIAPPVVSSISPTSGLTSGGTKVIIKGSGFTGATGVIFGSTVATSFTVDSDTQITAVSPAGSGQVDIMVTTSGGTSTVSNADQFTYVPTVLVWKAATGSTLLTYTGHKDSINALIWSPNGTRIASGSSDTTVQIWDATHGNHVFIYRRHTNAVLDIAWSPDGKYIASASADRTVQVWEVTTAQRVLLYNGHTSAVNAVEWSPDGSRIASAGADQTVQIWNALNGSAIFTYTGHSDAVNSIAWSPGGKYIASASSDTTVQVWSASTGNRIVTYRGHVNSVNTVAWSPDGKHIVSGGRDATVQVWNPI